MWRSPSMLIATAGAVVMFAVLPATALAGPAPTIESESVSHVTATDATLEAQIDPGSGEDGFALETTYEVLLEAPSCFAHGLGFCESTGGFPIAKGVIPAGSSAQHVSVDVVSAWQPLTPSTMYGYKVIAANGAGTRYGAEQTFTTLARPVMVPGLPPGSTPTPGPVGDEPKVPLGGGQPTTSGTSTSPPLGGAAPSSAQASTAGPEPTHRHKHHRKHKHHRRNTAKHPAKSGKHKR